MDDYWNVRYLNALAKVDEAKSTQVRLVYLDLASHYKAMRQLYGRTPAHNERRSAA